MSQTERLDALPRILVVIDYGVKTTGLEPQVQMSRIPMNLERRKTLGSLVFMMRCTILGCFTSLSNPFVTVVPSCPSFAGSHGQ